MGDIKSLYAEVLLPRRRMPTTNHGSLFLGCHLEARANRSTIHPVKRGCGCVPYGRNTYADHMRINASHNVDPSHPREMRMHADYALAISTAIETQDKHFKDCGNCL